MKKKSRHTLILNYFPILSSCLMSDAAPSSMVDVDEKDVVLYNAPRSNPALDEKHQILQNMDEQCEKKVIQAQTLLSNILDSVKKTEHATLRAGMKAGIEKLLYFIKDSKEGLDRTVLTILWGQAQKMVQDFNICAQEEHRRYEQKKRKPDELVPEQEALEEEKNEIASKSNELAQELAPRLESSPPETPMSDSH